jgi:hypothetical protein
MNSSYNPLAYNYSNSHLYHKRFKKSGTFGESASSEHHLELIVENNKLLRKCGALLSYFQALKLACRAHDHYRFCF